jgi:hypothetical protein
LYADNIYFDKNAEFTYCGKKYTLLGLINNLQESYNMIYGKTPYAHPKFNCMIAPAPVPTATPVACAVNAPVLSTIDHRRRKLPY